MTVLDRLAHASRWRNAPLAEKALLSLGLLLLALLLPPWPGAALVSAAAVTAALVGARIPPIALLRAALPALAFVAIGAASVLVSVDGSVAGGGRAALDLALRAVAALACLLLLALTTPAADLLRGLRRLGMPADLAELALATYRFVFLLDDTARAIHASQVARLGNVGWRRSLRSAGLLIAALLPRALDRARRLEAGLAARGFDGALPTLSRAQPATATGLTGVAALLASIAGASLWLI